MFSSPLVTVCLLIASNVFMTFAWYAHLRNLADRPWFVAALLSWGIALFEYLLQVPANRIGFRSLSLAQLKILQEVITLTGTSCGPACASSEPRISCSADRRIYRRELPHCHSLHVAKSRMAPTRERTPRLHDGPI